MKKTIVIVAILMIATMTEEAKPADPPANKLPTFKISTRKADDSVAVQGNEDRAVLAIKSPSGISHAVIERQEENWPKAVMLRLHLKGLESFQASNGTATLHAAVSFHDGDPKIRLWKDGKEDTLLDEKSPYWMTIRILNGEGKPARKAPLEDGYFEMTLPRAFFEGNPKTIKLNWIDFYR